MLVSWTVRVADALGSVPFWCVTLVVSEFLARIERLLSARGLRANELRAT
jgi:hypothetical protein